MYGNADAIAALLQTQGLHVRQLEERWRGLRQQEISSDRTDVKRWSCKKSPGSRSTAGLDVRSSTD